MHELCICSLCVTSERRNSGESSVLQVGYRETSDWTRKGCTKPDVVAGRATQKNIRLPGAVLLEIGASSK